MDKPTNVLQMLENKYYKLAYECGLQLVGIENGKPQWLGNQYQMNKYWRLLETNNLV